MPVIVFESGELKDLVKQYVSLELTHVAKDDDIKLIVESVPGEVSRVRVEVIIRE